jgi:hypothetical protein
MKSTKAHVIESPSLVPCLVQFLTLENIWLLQFINRAFHLYVNRHLKRKIPTFFGNIQYVCDAYQPYKLALQSKDIRTWMISHGFTKEMYIISYLAAGGTHDELMDHIGSHPLIPLSSEHRIYPMCLETGRIIRRNWLGKDVECLPTCYESLLLLATRFDNRRIWYHLLNENVDGTDEHLHSSLIREAIIHNHLDYVKALIQFREEHYHDQQDDLAEYEFIKSKCDWTEEQPIVHDNITSCIHCRDQWKIPRVGILNFSGLSIINLVKLAKKHNAHQVLRWLIEYLN